MRWAPTFGLAIALAAATATIARAEPRARLVITGDACDASALRAAVAALLGHDAFVDDAEPVDVTVRVSLVSAPGAFTGTIELEDGDTTAGQRTIAAADCTELMDAVSLAIAMVMDHPRTEPPRASAPVASVPEGSTEAPPLIVGTAAPQPRRIAGLEMSGGVAGGRASGGFQARVDVGIGLRRGRASLGLDFALGAPDRVTIGPGRVVVTTGSFELAGCLHRGSLAGCATAAVGWVRGRGEDLIDPSMATNPYVAPGARGQWDLAISDRLAARVQLGARVPLTRNRFLVDHMAVWSTSTIEAWLGLGLVAQIP
jgi:hypothetical protein